MLKQALPICSSLGIKKVLITCDTNNRGSQKLIKKCGGLFENTTNDSQLIANAMGIHASDKSLWSDTQYVRRLLSWACVETSSREIPFESWNVLPNPALLSIKHHREEGKNSRHRVVFKRVDGQPFVLDSAGGLPSNIR